MNDSKPTLAIALMIASIAFISVVDATCKAFTDELHAVQLVWGYFIGILTALCFYYSVRRVGWRDLTHTSRPLLLWLRSALLVGSIMSLFVGLTYLPLTDATAIGFMAPLFITALSVVLLKEQVGFHRWLAVIVGLIGVAIIVRPGGGIWHWAVIMPLIGAVCFALYQIITRIMTASESTHTILFYTGLGGVFWSTLVVIFFWREPQPEHWLVFFATGILGATAHLCLVEAFRRAQASLIAPFNYTKLIFVAILGYLLFDDVPTLNTLVGSGVIIMAGCYVLYRETAAAPSHPTAEI